MKTLLLFLALKSAVVMADPAATHGMVIFGSEKVYLSHLAMVHEPHDYHVLLEVEVTPQAKQVYLKNKSADPTLFTLVPEPFSLPDMIKNPKPFRAQIFKGHFEQGGQAIANTVVTIKKVIYVEKLMPLSSPWPCKKRRC